MIQIQEHKIPALRFPEFSGDWNTEHLEKYISRVGVPVSVEPDKLYREIGIRSHGKGLFHKEPVTGESLGNKRVFHVHIPAFVVNIVFAWEHAIAVTSENEEGFIASHRFPMFVSVENKSTISFVRYFFIRKYGKHLLGLASPGGAGRNKTLGQKDFAKLKVIFPEVDEQEKIALFLNAVDTKIEQISKKKILLEQYKKGMMHKLFSQETRFDDEQGKIFPDWEEKKLKDVLFEHKIKNESDEVSEVFSVAKHKGVINQIEHLGRSYAADSISHYKVANPYDIIYTKSPTGEFPFGIIKQNLTGRSGVVSPLYGVFRPLNKYIGYLLHEYFSYWINTYNYLIPLVQKGAKNTMSIRNDDFLNGAKIKLPMLEEEQKKIADFFSVLGKKIDAVTIELEQSESFKRALLQQMFI